MTRRADFLLVALAGVLWGTGGLAGAELGDAAGIDPAAVACYRLLGGGGLLLVVLVALRRLRGVLVAGRVRRDVAARVLGTAVLIAAFEAAYFEAVERAGVAVATLVTLGTAPLLVAGATSLRTRSWPPPRTLLALVLALGGLLLLVLGRTDAAATDAWGIVLALVAAAAFASLTAVNARPVPGLDGLAVTALSFTLGGLLLVPFAAVAGGLGLPADGAGWGWLLFLAVVPTAAAYSAYFTGLRTVTATTATLLSLLEPLTAAVLATALRDERLGPWGVLGSSLLVLAVVVLRPRADPSPTMVGPGGAAGLPRHPERPAPGASTPGVMSVSDPREGPAAR
ncbi:EamA family transporter [Cellulomonas sp. DKR-3]|uniref:EamA family transporter n=1 Tax=Cellulomonas fulva TaxID=2835530 RepID=A0ABS5TZW5_9CELL|nr:EamA family transporter [Cellulomonas fulva]MBT0994647.1 EamA family transporter [Cellulomonas fulva]